jgi:serine/threonine protein kinase
MVPAAGGHGEDPLIGTVLLERVRVIRPIARGGMGKVYYGEQVRMKRPCAIKVLDPRLGGESDIADFTRRFLLEASIAAKLTHPNVVTIFDYGETSDGSCFIAMEYLEGRSLSDELKAVGKIAPERAIHILRQVARALREAHALGVVHRDMKPGNVYLTRRDDDEDVVKVLDFGLVKDNAAGNESQDHTQLGQIMGSPRYMAPEQVQGKPVDARTDIYSVGAMLYAMLAGRPPFDKATELAIMMAQVSDPPPPLATAAPEVALPPGLEALVMKCLAKKPEDRFGSMEELVAALRLRPEGHPTTSDSGGLSARLLPPSIAAPPPEPPQRSATPWVLAGAVAVALAAGVTLMSTRGTLAGTVAAPPATPAVSAPPAASAPAPAPSAVKVTASLHVDTDPPGVKIKEEGDVMCEATPCDIVYTGAMADPTYEHLLTFWKADYKLERKLVKISASPLSVKMTHQR